MRIDADPSTQPVDASRDVSGTGPFMIGVDVTRIGPTPYAGYQWEIELPYGALARDGSAQNSIPSIFPLCSDTYDLSVGNANPQFGFGCASNSGGKTHLGLLSTVPIRCLADGTFAIRLIDIAEDPNFGSEPVSPGGTDLPAHTVGVTIHCSGTGVTLPPA
jgi:hypothetical protein